MNNSIPASWKFKYALRKIYNPKEVDFRVFGVGAAKTGTHSLGQMFDDRISSAHELDIEQLIYLHLERVSSSSSRKLHRYLLVRDKIQNLKIDASHINIYLVKDLELLFPGSKFILTLRHPEDWLRSFINDSLSREASPAFKIFREYRFGDTKHPREEEVLRANNLFTVEGYLNYWKEGIERVVSEVPASRLMILKTTELSSRSNEIAKFCSIGGFGVTPEKSKAYVNPNSFDVLDKLPEGYLDAIITTQCKELLNRYW